jgi:hypothetical protein
MALKSLRSTDLTFLTSPNRGTQTIDGQSVVRGDQVKAKALYDAFGADSVAAYLAGTAPSPAAAR